ncbi:PRC-barrel domain-containing protein [Candidatus Saccharibacteria bacterium]|jgi:uncharacterized protein YrrD|nr:PRC-barrel domain-containing protein [Candidatus Saccharibacteria bacterium]MBR3253317.1 PRC-barrel domain-containing protein [Candidatus Saccharibacteria bacterium]
MLIYASRLIGTPVLSVQAGGRIASVSELIVDPDTLKIIAFKLTGPLVMRSSAKILDVKSVREYSNFGIVIDDIDELIEKDDVVKISKVLDLNFDLNGLKVETKKGSKLGKVEDYTLTSEDFIVQQLIVKRKLLKSFLDPELTISRKEIVEITDYKVIIKDEEKTVKKKAEKEEFVPNFVNPFRNHEQDFAPADTQNPGDKDTE